MGAQSADTDDLPTPRVSWLTAERSVTYQLDVIGVDAADVVRAAGGWLFDRVMAGWDVQVTLTEECDLRPLRILGVLPGERRDEPAALAVAGGLLSGEGTLPDEVRAVLTRRRSEVTVWNSGRMTGLEPVCHVLSSAARVFKRQALLAAGLDAALAAAPEVFRAGNRSLLVVPPDLVPN